MKERFTNELLGMVQNFSRQDIEYLKNVLPVVMNNYDITLAKNEIVEWNIDENYDLLKLFIVAKQVEGCTIRTIEYYRSILKIFLDSINIPLQEVTTNHIRFYLANRELRDKVSKTTQDNERRILSSFFGWLAAEEYIDKNPILRIKAIRGEKKKKKAFSEIEIERIRNGCKTKRERCIIEILLSTGCRVAGLVGMNISEIENDSIVVHEKGKKDRTVFFNVKAKIAIEEYLAERKDSNDALIVSMDKPYSRTQISGIESIIRELGKRVGIHPCYPHRFRRTCATLARRRGMPLEDIQKMLGHENIETTMIYISDDEEKLSDSHKKYVV